MSDLIDYEVVGWLVERDDESKECVLGTLEDSIYIGEGDEANALAVIRRGSIPTLLDRIKSLQQQLEEKSREVESLKEAHNQCGLDYALLLYDNQQLKAENEKLVEDKVELSGIVEKLVLDIKDLRRKNTSLVQKSISLHKEKE